MICGAAGEDGEVGRWARNHLSVAPPPSRSPRLIERGKALQFCCTILLAAILIRSSNVHGFFRASVLYARDLCPRASVRVVALSSFQDKLNRPLPIPLASRDVSAAHISFLLHMRRAGLEGEREASPTDPELSPQLRVRAPWNIRRRTDERKVKSEIAGEEEEWE